MTIIDCRQHVHLEQNTIQSESAVFVFKELSLMKVQETVNLARVDVQFVLEVLLLTVQILTSI